MSTSCPSSGIFLVCRSQHFGVFIGGTSSSCATWCVQLAESGVDIWVLYGSDGVLQRWFRSGLQGMNQIFTMKTRGFRLFSGSNKQEEHILMAWPNSCPFMLTLIRIFGSNSFAEMLGWWASAMHPLSEWLRWFTAIILRKTTRCSVLSWNCAVTRLYDQDQVSSFLRPGNKDFFVVGSGRLSYAMLCHFVTCNICN